MYQQYLDSLTGKPFDSAIIRLADNACIPFDPANRDYAESLRWLEEGNEPLPADEQPTAAEQPAED